MLLFFSPRLPLQDAGPVYALEKVYSCKSFAVSSRQLAAFITYYTAKQEFVCYAFECATEASAINLCKRA